MNMKLSNKLLLWTLALLLILLWASAISAKKMYDQIIYSGGEVGNKYMAKKSAAFQYIKIDCQAGEQQDKGVFVKNTQQWWPKVTIEHGKSFEVLLMKTTQESCQFMLRNDTLFVVLKKPVLENEFKNTTDMMTIKVPEQSLKGIELVGTTMNVEIHGLRNSGNFAVVSNSINALISTSINYSVFEQLSLLGIGQGGFEVENQAKIQQLAVELRGRAYFSAKELSIGGAFLCKADSASSLHISGQLMKKLSPYPQPFPQ